MGFGEDLLLSGTLGNEDDMLILDSNGTNLDTAGFCCLGRYPFFDPVRNPVALTVCYVVSLIVRNEIGTEIFQ